MRFPDPYTLRNDIPQSSVIFGVRQQVGSRDTQEDCFANFTDECFVLADGVGNLPNGEVAAKLACDTSVWAYKHIRQHRYYWGDKKLFMKRIFRSTNLAVWQKHREKGFESGLATTLLVLMVGPKHIWLGNAGDSVAWLFHDGDMTKLTSDKREFDAIPDRSLGIVRLGLKHEFVTMPFEKNDVIVVATDGVGDYLTPQDIQTGVAAAGVSPESLTHAASTLITAATTNGSADNMTAMLLKRA